MNREEAMLTTTMKAIETRYKNHLFRSRLEARWAVFFDSLGIRWEYEPEGFELEDGIRYLPDFRLHRYGLGWIEIKPSGEMSPEDSRKCIAFGKALHADVEKTNTWVEYHILCGSPVVGGYEVRSVTNWPKTGWSISNTTGVEQWTHCPLCGLITLAHAYGEIEDGAEGLQCMHCDCVDRNWKETSETWFHKGTVMTRKLGFIEGSPLLKKAYQSAMSARFEHGQTPS
jgi:hypothetical protein